MQNINLETLKRSASVYSLPSSVQLRALLPLNHTGCFIGMGGATARRVQEDCNVFLSLIQVPGLNWGNVFCVKAHPEGQSKAWTQCLTLLSKNYGDFYQKNGYRIYFMFPNELINLFLSTGVIELIAKESRTLIIVKDQCLPRSTERLLIIKLLDFEEKSLKNFKTAIHMLARVVEENITLAMCAPGNIFYVQEANDNILKMATTGNYTVFAPKREENRPQ